MKQRRLSFQLAPLLDLMLVVFFLQFIDIRQKEQNALQAVSQERHKIDDEVNDLQAARDAAVDELSRIQEQLADLRVRLRQADERKVQLEESLDQSAERQQRLGELVGNLWKVPSPEMEKLLREAESPTSINSAANRQKLLEKFRQIASASPADVIHQLLSLDEIRKRCDVWELTIDRSGVAHLSTGQNHFDLRIPLTAREAVERQQFEDSLFVLYKSLPQPKNLVIILFTYDRATRLMVAESVSELLPNLVGRMTADSGGNARFEYADLGFRTVSK